MSIHGKGRIASGMMRIAPLALGLGIGGCGGSGGSPADVQLRPITGQVLVAGKPAAGVEVQLYPLNQSGEAGAPRLHATTDRDGNFRLRVDESREGAPEGQYHVTLAWPTSAGGTDRLGGVYSEPGGSGLTAIIDAETTSLPPYDVKAGRQRRE